MKVGVMYSGEEGSSLLFGGRAGYILGRCGLRRQPSPQADPAAQQAPTKGLYFRLRPGIEYIMSLLVLASRTSI